MMKKTFTGVAIAAAAALALSGCGGSSKSPAKSTGGSTPSSPGKVLTAYNPQSYDNLKSGGKVTLPISEIPTQLNPFQGNSDLYTSEVAWFYTPNLSYGTPAGDINFNPDYLTSVKQTTVAGNTVVTYDINPKANWNDGTPIDANAFIDTWKANNGTNKAFLVASSDGYANMTSVKQGKDAKEAVVTYKGTYVWWKYMFGGLVSPHAATPTAFNKAYVSNPHSEWGAGPYVISKFDSKGGTITYTPNPKWWGKKPKLTSFTWTYLEPTAAINSFKNGQTDLVSASTADQLNQVKSMSNIDIRRGTSTSINLYTFNAKSPVLGDTATRKALMEGIDRSQLAKVEFQGLNYTEALPGSFDLYNFQKGFVDNFGKLVQFNADQAKKDLDAAGWKVGAGGVRSKGGKKLEMNIVWFGDNPTRKALASATAAMLKNIGVKLDLKNEPAANFQKVITDRSFDIMLSGFTSGSSNGMAYICQVYCSDSQLNLSASIPKSFDKTVQAVTELPTMDQQIQQGNKVEAQAMKTYGIMPIYNGPSIVVTKKGLANIGAAQFYGNYGYLGPPELIGWQK
ncbi:MAG TPA: ABC transporter family substrate-binding protein [Mycobacteriales bacterium]|jgi:peptide/nickel transport system substrate-binding protein|nr:ABC transporter family substrate-binding protein [Mycobacteriales bacterium]